MASKTRKTIVINNTPIGWTKLAKEAEINTQLTVRTSIKGQLDDQQLFCLRYCFVELDRLEQYNLVCYPFTLQINVENKRDAFRIQHYLAVMTALRDINLEVFCDNQTIFGLRQLSYDFYRILPLICVGEKKQKWMTSYSSMAGPGNTAEIQDLNIQDFQKESPTLHRSNDKTSSLLHWLCMQNLWCLLRDLSGSEEETMNKTDKQTLSQDLLLYLRGDLPRLSLLARLIWTIFLRSFSDSKDLFYRDEKKRWHIDMETLRCTRLDAISYAEGLLQLMENACIHSQMKRSYISIRIRDVNITAKGPMRVAEAAQTRLEIYRRHEQLFTVRAKKGQAGDSRQSKLSFDYKLERYTKFCLEFSVLNDALLLSPRSPSELWGIVRTFAYNRHIEDWAEMNLDYVFSYRCNNENDIAKHYGLRLLEKTVHLNGGLFSVLSPGIPGEQTRYSSFYHGQAKTYCDRIDSNESYTEFNVLLPLHPHWHTAQEASERSSPPESHLQCETLKGLEYRQRVLRLQYESVMAGHKPFFKEIYQLLPPPPLSLAGSFLAQSTQGEWLQFKEQLITQLWEELDSWASNPNDILLLDLMPIRDVISLELLAKSIFYLLASHQKQHKHVLLALLLPDEMYISEFIRLFSIFYDKQESAVQWMGTSQIALCGYQEEHGRYFPQVYFLLAGKSSGAARITARTFAYYNARPSLDLLPQIRYLTRMAQETAVPQFPFDLFLTASLQSPLNQKSWFLEGMNRALEQDLWKRPYGCRLKDIRVRLHSNIYLSTFYEAELFFQNVGIIYRFAHLIVRQLLTQLPSDPERPLVVVGYEFYSSVLTEQIAQLLTKTWWETHYLIYANSQENERIHLSPKLKHMQQKERENILNQGDYVVILPIGTTMSTLYYIMEEIRAQWANSRFPYENYVLILVGENSEIMSPRYWHLTSPNQITLCPQNHGDPATRCRFFLSPKTQWSEMRHDPKGSGEDESVLVYVDKTSTRPKEIFLLENAHFQGTSHFLADSRENDRRLALLKGLIHYGHIAEGNNHFQFYVDMEQYFSRAQQADPKVKHKTVNQWLQSLRDKVDPNAYNIIVSPLHKEDSPFAKAVIDQVFEHSLRFLHMNLSDTYREDVRAKFSYIADDYRAIRQFDRERPVNVYFVNTAITSGSTLIRAKSLVTMLMAESGIKYDRESIFKGCFVLINRSAYDTLNSYVKDPEQHFWAYLHLAVPSFNSRRDRCPTCELTEQYRILENSSAMNYLGHEFRRLQLKHKKRTLKEYQSWLENTAMHSGGYAGWLRQWLYNYVREPHRTGSDYQVGIFTISSETYSNLLALYHLLQWGIKKFLNEREITIENHYDNAEKFLQLIHSFTLLDLKRLVEQQSEEASNIAGNCPRCLEPEYWIRVLIDFVCAQKNYLRMTAIHRSFLKLDTLAGNLPTGIPDRASQTSIILAELIKEQLGEVSHPALKAEWLISFIKVLSRPHLAQYHHVRQGILTLMLHFTAYATCASETLPEHIEFVQPFLQNVNNETGEMIRSQILQTLLKRLAGLQSTYFLHKSNMERIVASFNRLRQSFLSKNGDGAWEYKCFNPVPTSIQVEQNMIKLVKWTSSYGDDENGCYLIEESFLNLKGEN